jgi:hypothetical protein
MKQNHFEKTHCETALLGFEGSTGAAHTLKNFQNQNFIRLVVTLGACTIIF